MERDKRLAVVEEVITFLREECSVEDSLRIIGVCASFYLHRLPKEKRTHDLETWVYNLYETQCELEKHFGNQD